MSFRRTPGLGLRLLFLLLESATPENELLDRFFLLPAFSLGMVVTQKSPYRILKGVPSSSHSSI